MTKRKLTDQQEQEIVARYKAGESTIRLAKAYGVGSSTTISNVLTRNGVTPTARKFTDQQEQEIIARRKAGESTIQLGKAYGVDSGTIGNVLRRKGATLKAKGGAKRKLTDQQEQEIVARYNNRETAARLGKAYGVASRTIRNALLRNGVTLRGSGEYLRKLTAQQEREVVARYNAGEVTLQLGKAYGVADETIGHILRRHGVKLRSSGESRRKFSAQQEQEIIARYNAKEDTVQLGKAYGVSNSLIHKMLLRNGVATRGNTISNRAARFTAQLQELITSLGDHLQELPLKSWLLILQQSDAIQSVGDQSALTPIKLKLLEGKITADDLAPTADGTPGGKLQEAIDELVAGLSDEELAAAETEDEPGPSRPAEVVDVADEPEERTNRLLELSVQKMLDVMTAADRVLKDEQALDLICSGQVDQIWAKVFRSTDPAAVVAEARAAVETSPWAAEVRNTFLADWELLAAVESVPGFRPAAGFQLNLMQRREAALLRRDHCRLNISAMGAGKTLAALAGVHLIGCERVLVLAPNNALGSWTTPLSEQFPDSQWQLKTWQPQWQGGSGPQFLICNHEMLSDGADGRNANAVATLLAEWGPDAVVIDEIHQCKNRNQEQESQRHRNLIALTGYVREAGGVIYGMTGTPIINELSEGISLLKLVQPAAADGLKSTRTIGSCLALHHALQPLTSRYVPPAPCGVVSDVVTVNADALLPHVQTACECSLSALESVLATVKIPAVVDLARGADKVLIFTSAIFEVVEPMRRALVRAGIRTVVHTGEEKWSNGERSVDAFLNNPDVKVLLASSGTLATGFDGLQRICNRIIFLTLPWTAAEHEQAIARIVRQGTTFRQVQVTTVVAQLTDPESGEPWSLDEQKLVRLTTKRSLGAAVCDGVIPDRAALLCDEDSVRRGLRKWQRKVRREPVAA